LATNWARHYARQVVQRDDADDVGARVGTRLFTVTRSGREGPWRTQPPIPPSLGEWVKTAVRFELRNDARYRRRHPEDLVDAEALVAGSQERGAFEMESNMEIEDVLERAADVLTAEDRAVVFMLSRLEMSQVEVSRQLKVTPQAVNQRLGRIKDKAPQLAVQLAS
jgi:DNA-directed RNA polymerase specialized sigma24 family protein